MQSKNLKVLIDDNSFPDIKINGITFTKEFEEGIVGIIAGTDIIDLDKYKNLKVISRFGTGLDNIDLKEAKKRGIHVYNTPDAPTTAVAEFTIYLILAMNRYLTLNLKNKTVGIIGYGRIGSTVGRILESFGCKVQHYDPLCYPYTSVDINEILSSSDIITLHIPMNKDNEHFIDVDKVKLMKRKPLIINTCRKNIVDEVSIYEALKNKLISGFASDVNDEHIFKEFPNTIITPHIASNTIETRNVMVEVTIKNLMRGLYEVE